MARYAIYDNESSVITPIGEELTAEQWLNRHPWGRRTKMVVGGGVINGNVAFVFDELVSNYAKLGANFAMCTSDQDFLDVIEKFQDAQNSADNKPLSTDERIANALEDLVVLRMEDLPEEEL